MSNPTLITASMIYEEQQEIKKMLSKLLEREAEHSIEEISLGKTAKLLRLGSETVIRYVENGKLKARPYRDHEHKKRYRFRIADIREFQNNNSTLLDTERQEVESSEAMIERLTGLKSKRRLNARKN